MSGESQLRHLPAVDTLLQSEQGTMLRRRFGHDLTVGVIRAVLDEIRERVLEQGGTVPAGDAIMALVARRVYKRINPSLRPVINATGVIIHTNLGRAPLSAASRAAVTAVAGEYSNLEFDLAAGTRGSRTVHAADLICELTGAEAALVVNNTAAAVLLMLTALCRDKEVIISRGQLVEIGGGFRVPDVMVQSGARLVEVGTTNRTHFYDYERALSEETGAIMVAHHSNFKIIGFTTEPSLAELAELARGRDIPLLYDQGSGALRDTGRYGLDPEPTVQEGLAAGADLITFSGDKLLGGPQAGIIIGRQNLVEQLRRHPLARAIRTDKLCLAGLAATLRHYVLGEEERSVPVWRMMAISPESLSESATSWARELRGAGIDARTEPGQSTIGGGTLPGQTLPTTLVSVGTDDVEAAAAALRGRDPAVVGRVSGNRLLFDPRTILPGQDEILLEALLELLGSRE